MQEKKEPMFISDMGLKAALKRAMEIEYPVDIIINGTVGKYPTGIVVTVDDAISYTRLVEGMIRAYETRTDPGISFSVIPNNQDMEIPEDMRKCTPKAKELYKLWNDPRKLLVEEISQEMTRKMGKKISVGNVTASVSQYRDKYPLYFRKRYSAE